MILILSENDDQSTNRVLDWLHFYKMKYIRVNPSDKIVVKIIKIDQVGLSVLLEIENKGVIKLEEITGYWYRRGYFNFSYYNRAFINDEIFDGAMNRHLFKEIEELKYFIHVLLNNKKHIGNFFFGRVNKLLSLEFAKKAGLKIPNTSILTTKEQLKDFQEKHITLITKSVHEVFRCEKKDISYRTYTEEINREKIDELNLTQTYFPSLFQKKIDKLYELRIFYLNSKCYSMAIFSQHDPKTQVDYRKYNDLKPNRNIPYQLPEDIEEKINYFMEEMELNCGSIDMIVDRNYDYLFLEVNPVGQFGMTSFPCNYLLHKRIADFFSGK